MIARITVGFGWAVIIFFFLLWAQGGWYRIDCALSIREGCALISAEYADAAAKRNKDLPK